MTTLNFIQIAQWWFILAVIGIIFLPLTTLIFNKFFDKGYIFAKVIGIIVISYIAFVFGELHLITFSQLSIFAIVFLCGIGSVILFVTKKNTIQKKHIKVLVGEELLFLSGLLFWSAIRSYQPDIQGLEKYMDFGFVNSILRAKYFPPLDMWYPPFPINYYYFGHLYTALLTKLSGIPSFITFNLMIATLFAFCFTGAFSLGANLMYLFLRNKNSHETTRFGFKLKSTIFITGLLSAFLTSLGGNLHTIYAFFKPYDVDNPVPFWKLPLLVQNFPNAYWYPNATRFIYHTIHEFPIYSFVVSDLHGHVLDIPIVLLTLAVILALVLQRGKPISLFWTISIGFLLAIMYMTNAWDGIIYMLLAGITYFANILPENQEESMFAQLTNKKHVLKTVYHAFVTFVSFLLFALPLSLFFKPFASQIGLLCSPAFLLNIGHFGPFLFEQNHCQRSPLYQLFILHGFFLFWFFGFSLYLFLRRKKEQISPPDIFIVLLGILSILLIIIPEFVYLKDIYPAHYRANTMFKLVYQAFIMLGISTGYIIIRLFISFKSKIVENWKFDIRYFVFFFFGIFGFFFVAIYPYFAITSYYGTLTVSYGLEGLNYLKKTYPSDYNAIVWINKNIKGQPVILEAQGDSYTDYARVSANTGLPTVLGWTVHEWLWRGSYDPLPSRIDDIQRLYETKDLGVAKGLIKKYHVAYVFVGDLERKKYTNLNLDKFTKLGKVVYAKDTTIIYQLNPL